jgi:hypothetical protein
MVEGLCYNPEGRGFESQCRNTFNQNNKGSNKYDSSGIHVLKCIDCLLQQQDIVYYCVSIISGTDAAVCTTVVVVRCNGR